MLQKRKIQNRFLNFFSRRRGVVFCLFVTIFFFTGNASASANSIVSDIYDAGVTTLKASLGIASGPASSAASAAVDFVGDKATEGLYTVFQMLIYYGVFVPLSWLASAGANILITILQPGTFEAVANSEVIYTIWQMVRDVLNLFFILILLFSAFATIFQVDKYNYRKMLLTIILMALLVNFSWPISRAIVDFFNSMMYFFIFSLFGYTTTDQVGSGLLSMGKLGGVFLPNGTDSGLPELILGVIVMFLFAISLLVMAIMLLIRLVALPIIIMFSPVGFVGMIIPSTGYARDWWKNLFKYASYGPVMVFMILVAIRVAQSTQVLWPKFKVTAGNITAANGSALADPSFLASASYFIIPIILFWIAITSAEKMSSNLAHSSIKIGSRMGKWGAGLLVAGGTFGTYPAVRNAYESWDKSRAQARADATKRWGGNIGSTLSNKFDEVTKNAGLTPGARADAAKRLEAENIKRVKDAAEKGRMEEKSGQELRQLASSSDKYVQAAAILELASKGLAEAGDLKKVRQSMGEKSSVTRQLENKMKAYDPIAVFSDINGVMTDQGRERMKSFVQSNQFDAKKLGPQALGNADLMAMMFEAGAISNKDLDDLRGRSAVHAASIQKSLDEVANKFTEVTSTDPGNVDADNKAQIARNVQTAYLAQTGKLHTSIADNSAKRIEIARAADKDTMKRVKKSLIVDESGNTTDFAVEVTQNMQARNYKSMIENMDGDARDALNAYVKELQNAQGPGLNQNQQRLSRQANEDPQLRNIG